MKAVQQDSSGRKSRSGLSLSEAESLKVTLQKAREAVKKDAKSKEEFKEI
ncbi:MAG: hypothetical protein ACR2PX_21345 [Endozoicomonas sp.]